MNYGHGGTIVKRSHWTGLLCASTKFYKGPTASRLQFTYEYSTIRKVLN